MSYEMCEVHGCEATNGCAHCRCDECGAPLYLHGHAECMNQQLANAIEAGKQLWVALEEEHDVCVELADILDANDKYWREHEES